MKNSDLIRGLWRHHFEARLNLLVCVKATLAILLGRENPDILDGDHEGLYCFNFGTYETDYGTGTSWDFLVLGPLFTYAIGSDGSL